MAEVTGGFSSIVLGLYDSFISALPQWAGDFINFILIVLLVFVYSWFIWNFYRFIARKNILKLDLRKYNRSEHPFFTKLIAGVLYFIEYIIILPFITFFWFAVFALFFILLTENLEMQRLLLISATIVAAIRMAAYYKEDLSKDIAKLLPFTLLAISILGTSDFFSMDRVFSQLSQIPAFFSQIVTYLIFIVLLEIVLRFFDFIFSLFGLENPEEEVKVQPIVNA